jgi:predicted transcriptional regulator
MSIIKLDIRPGSSLEGPRNSFKKKRFVTPEIAQLTDQTNLHVLVWQVLKAIKAAKLTSPVSGWLLKKVVQVSEDTPINEVRNTYNQQQIFISAAQQSLNPVHDVVVGWP